jgi:hypothetical protein
LRKSSRFAVSALAGAVPLTTARFVHPSAVPSQRSEAPTPASESAEFW